MFCSHVTFDPEGKMEMNIAIIVSKVHGTLSINAFVLALFIMSLYSVFLIL